MHRTLPKCWVSRQLDAHECCDTMIGYESDESHTETDEQESFDRICTSCFDHMTRDAQQASAHVSSCVTACM